MEIYQLLNVTVFKSVFQKCHEDIFSLRLSNVTYQSLMIVYERGVIFNVNFTLNLCRKEMRQEILNISKNLNRDEAGDWMSQ